LDPLIKSHFGRDSIGQDRAESAAITPLERADAVSMLPLLDRGFAPILTRPAVPGVLLMKHADRFHVAKWNETELAPRVVRGVLRVPGRDSALNTDALASRVQRSAITSDVIARDPRRADPVRETEIGGLE
jgi:hypothetical protein